MRRINYGKILVTVEETYTKTYEVEAEDFDEAVEIIENCPDCTYSPIFESDSVVRNFIPGE